MATRLAVGFRVTWMYLRVQAMNELQYRANLVVQLFQSLLALATGLAVLGLVFHQVNQLNGWSQAQLVVLLGVFTLMGGITRTVIQPSMAQLMEEIRDGKLDHLLAKPVDAQLLASVRGVRVWQAVDVAIGIVLVGIGMARLNQPVPLTALLGFLVALLLGVVMLYCFWMIVSTTAFWFVQIEKLADMVEGVYQAGRWPTAIYPAWLKVVVTFVLPVAFAVTLPAQAITARDSGLALLGEAVLATAFFVGARLFWRLGLRHYSGASS